MSMLDTILRMTGSTPAPPVLRAEDYRNLTFDVGSTSEDKVDEKPGLRPRAIHDLSRLHDVKDAIDSAIEAGIEPEAEWFEEMRDLMDRLGMEDL